MDVTSSSSATPGGALSIAVGRAVVGTSPVCFEGASVLSEGFRVTGIKVATGFFVGCELGIGVGFAVGFSVSNSVGFNVGLVVGAVQIGW